MNQNLELLESKIRNFLPSLMEVSEGCVIENEHGNRFVVITEDSDVYYVFETKYHHYTVMSKSVQPKIIGHPIQLSDVLLFLGVNYGITGDGAIYKCTDMNGFIYTGYDWNLSLPLSGQSDDVILFLLNIK